MIETWKHKGDDLQLQCIGKEIQRVEIVEGDYGENTLAVRFTDGSGIGFTDDGQQCCEVRYMSADGDDLSEFVGAKYIEAFVKAARETEDEYGVHEILFLEIRTSKGSITVSAHNEHNGYYGGFDIVVEEI